MRELSIEQWRRRRRIASIAKWAIGLVVLFAVMFALITLAVEMSEQSML